MPETQLTTGTVAGSRAQLRRVAVIEDAAHLVYARACWPHGGAAEHRLLALQIALIVAIDNALEHSPPLESRDDEYQTFLPWHPPNGAELSSARTAVRRTMKRLETGLALRGVLAGGSASASPVPAIWWRRQAEAFVGAGWQEARWRASPPPDEATYLAVAEHSIGVGWLVASLVRLNASPLAPAAASRLHAATRAVALAVRTANDLQDLERERREGKVQLVFLRARALERLGLPPAQAECRALAELEIELVERLGRARALLEAPEWADSARLRTGLQGMLGAAMALYAGNASWTKRAEARPDARRAT